MPHLPALLAAPLLLAALLGCLGGRLCEGAGLADPRVVGEQQAVSLDGAWQARPAPGPLRASAYGPYFAPQKHYTMRALRIKHYTIRTLCIYSVLFTALLLYMHPRARRPLHHLHNNM